MKKALNFALLAITCTFLTSGFVSAQYDSNIDLDDGVLTIETDNSDDVVQLQVEGNQLVIYIAHFHPGTFGFEFDQGYPNIPWNEAVDDRESDRNINNIHTIRIETFGGDDLVEIDSSVNAAIVVDSGDDSDVVVDFGYGGTLDASLGSGENTFYSAGRSDGIVVNSGNDRDWIYIDDDVAGDDWISSGAGDNYIRTGKGNDIVYSGNGRDQIDLGEGHDVAHSGSGNDTVSCGGGNDIAFGGAGNDEIAGGTGDDILYGQSGSDEIVGSSGQDELYGGSSVDELIGGPDNDKLYGGDDGVTDWLEGGSGYDTAIVEYRTVDRFSNPRLRNQTKPEKEYTIDPIEKPIVITKFK